MIGRHRAVSGLKIMKAEHRGVPAFAVVRVRSFRRARLHPIGAVLRKQLKSYITHSFRVRSGDIRRHETKNITCAPVHLTNIENLFVVIGSLTGVLVNRHSVLLTKVGIVNRE